MVWERKAARAFHFIWLRGFQGRLLHQDGVSADGRDPCACCRPTIAETSSHFPLAFPQPLEPGRALRQAPDLTRRIPKQGRSAATVDALLTAATQILARDGFDQFSTTATAKRAGVSIGSLYQYFQNRDALLGAVAARELYRLSREIADTFQRAVPGTRSEAVSRVIIANVTAASADRKAALSCVLSLTSRSNPGDEVRAVMAIIGNHLALERQITPAAAFVLTRAVLGVASAALVEQPALDPDEIARALSTLIKNYFAYGDEGDARLNPVQSE